MGTSNVITAYESDSMSHRLVVESSLIHACNTIRRNKSTASTRDIDLLAPMILKGASLDWTAIARVQPNSFRTNAIPRKHLKLFKHSSNVPGPSPMLDPQIIEDSQVPGHSYYLRSQRSLGTSSIGNQVVIGSTFKYTMFWFHCSLGLCKSTYSPCSSSDDWSFHETLGQLHP